MNTEKMTVHKALAELKIIDDRIAKAIRDGVFVDAAKKGTLNFHGMTKEEYMNKMRADKQKASDLIERQKAMRRAVTLSNATTMVTVAGVEMTVAEAIAMKNHGMENEQRFLYHLSNRLNDAKNMFDRYNGENLEILANDYVQQMLRAQGESANNVDEKTIKALHDQYIALNEYEMIDPLHVADIISDKDDFINEFNADCDAALSVSNAITEIEFSY